MSAIAVLLGFVAAIEAAFIFLLWRSRERFKVLAREGSDGWAEAVREWLESENAWRAYTGKVQLIPPDHLKAAFGVSPNRDER